MSLFIETMNTERCVAMRCKRIAKCYASCQVGSLPSYRTLSQSARSDVAEQRGGGGGEEGVKDAQLLSNSPSRSQCNRSLKIACRIANRVPVCLSVCLCTSRHHSAIPTASSSLTPLFSSFLSQNSPTPRRTPWLCCSAMDLSHNGVVIQAINSIRRHTQE